MTRLRTRLLAAGALALATAGMLSAARPAAAATTTYYVNCSATTNGSGTQASPWNSTVSVNAVVYQPGDTIDILRGTTCSGHLAPQGSGSSSAVITVDAYGTGARPVIAAGSTADAAFKLSDQSYWDVQNLEITGGVHYGVLVTGATANATLTHIYLTNLDVHGATATTITRGDSGEVYVYPTGSKEVIDDVVISGVTAHDSNVSQGIFAGGAYGAFPAGTVVGSPGSTPIGQNITITNSTAYNVAGDGVLLTMAQNSTIENSVAYNSGSCATCTGSTPSGLWEWYCQTCTLQYNEAYDNHSYTNYDGGAFDIDNYDGNNVLQFNYGHDNDGYCLAVYDGSGYSDTNDVFRYNVCANNVRKSTAAWGELYVTNSVTNMQIYNNTFYNNPADSVQFLGVESVANGFFKNNIVYSTSTNLLKSSTSGFRLDNNDYYITTGSAPSFSLNGTAYSGLTAFQNATGEDVHSLTANPLLNSPAYHATGKSLSADTLQAGSPAFGAGVDVCQGIAGCAMGSQDYFGDPITTAGAHTIGAYDIPAPLSQLTNPGFEAGTCAGWNCYAGAAAVNSHARTGSYAVQLPPGGGAEQTITGLKPATTYRLGGFGETSAAGNCVYVGVKSYGGSDTRTCLSGTSYTGGAVTFTTGSASTSAVVYFWYPSGNTGTGWGDDLTLGAVPATPAYGALANTGSGTCLDIPGNTTTNGTQADIWACNGGANQILTHTSGNLLQVYYGSNLRCLDDFNSATTSGSPAGIWTCNGAANQQWILNANGTVTSVVSGLCLGTAGGATNDGTLLQIQTCSGSATQKWTRQ
jgi:hypothetical protein